MEEEFKRKGLTRAPMASNIRSKRTIVDANWEKFVDKAQGNSYPSNKNFCSGTSSSEGSSSSNNIMLVMVLAMSFQFPSKPVVMFLNIFFLI